jgi:glutamine cyclotransferase
LLILSDSTETLQLRHRETLGDTTKRLTVHEPGKNKAITRANELESIVIGDKHYLIANHFMTQDLMILDGDTGEILCVADLSSLNRGVHRTPSCGPPTANGIAYDAATNRLWLTGKYWYFIHEVKLTLDDGVVIGGGQQ